MDDRRQHSRHTTQLNIEALDLHSGRRLGRVVDLSEDGFMLISETPPEADSVWECRLVLDQPLDGLEVDGGLAEDEELRHLTAPRRPNATPGRDSRAGPR